MADISQSVRRGLARQATAARLQEHPDADLLAGFLERSLTAAEQRSVLEHVSFCGVCRDVVSAALPEAVATQPALAPAPAAAGWRSLVLARWAAVAAAVVIAVGALVMYRAQENIGSQSAQIAQHSTVASPAPGATSETAPAASEKPAAGADKTSVANLECGGPNCKNAESAVRQPEARREARQAQPTLALASPIRKEAKARAIAPAVSAPPVSERDRLASSDASATAPAAVIPAAIVAEKADITQPSESANAPVDALTAQNRGFAGAAGQPQWAGRVLPQRMANSFATAAPPAAPAASPGEAALAKAEPAPEGIPNFGSQDLGPPPAPAKSGRFTLALSSRALGARMAQRSLLTTSGSSPAVSSIRWTISDSRVQRSTDGGASWKTMDVGDGITFHVVAHSGTQVWAGGSDAALFHSPNDGGTWHRVVPTTFDRTLKGDVISIDFGSQARALRVLTSTGEIWETIDGGQHWTVR